MAKGKSTSRLWFREDKMNKKFKAPIFIIFSVKGQRATYNTGIKVHPVQWNDKRKTIIPLNKKGLIKIEPNYKLIDFLDSFEVKKANNNINNLLHLITEVEERFKLDKVAYSSKMVIEKLKEQLLPITKKENNEGNVVDWIRCYSKECTNTHKSGTIKCYTGLANHLEAFQANLSFELSFKSLTRELIGKFRDFLNFEKRQNNTTVAKQLSTLFTLINKARVDYAIEVNMDYKDFKHYGREDSSYEVIALDDDEFKSMLRVDLSQNPRLDKQRDVFIFSAVTGLRYSDLKDLKRAHIKNDSSIEKICVKTGRSLKIPLIGVAKKILDKYKTNLRPLPIISNDKCRKYVKEIAKICGIDTPIPKSRKYGTVVKEEVIPKYKLMGIHTGRKTFVTLMLANGVPAQEVMGLSGHSTYNSFKRYVDFADKQREKAMEKGLGMYSEVG
jgi:integrase